MRILFADAIEPEVVDRLGADGHDCEVRPDLTADDLGPHLRGVEVLVVRSTRVGAGAIGAAERLELVVRAGAGTNTIDTAAAASAGVYVCNVPGRNAVAVAELTLGLLTAIDRRIVDATVDLRAGRWDKTTYGAADGLLGKRLAVLGLGAIGLAVARRAVAFGMTVATLDRPGRHPATRAEIEALDITLVDDLDSLLAASDVVSLHVPADPSTAGMVDAAFLARLPDGAILLNTARADLIDEAALLAALDERDLRVGLDVWPDEPGTGRASFDSALARHPRVVGTHHIGASTRQAQRAIADGTYEVVAAYGRGEILHCVNLETQPLGTSRLTVRHYDRVGVLASVLDVLRRADLNVEQMENRVFAGRKAAVAVVEVGGPVTATVRVTIEDLPDVLGVSCHTR